jgi:WhiB family transcriptional regulator, redox-sensing transcriptional regulator
MSNGLAVALHEERNYEEVIYPMATTRRSLFSFLPVWMDDPRVKCKGLNKYMYPNQPSSEVTKAKALCNGQDGNAPCAMRAVCLRHAIDNHESYGVWGGTSERDRRKIQRARNLHKNRAIYNLEDVRFPQTIVIKRQTVVYIKRRHDIAA